MTLVQDSNLALESFSLERGRRSADLMPARDAILHGCTLLLRRAH